MFLLLLCLLAGSDAVSINLEPSEFMKLNTSQNFQFDNGAATASTFDEDLKYLYVIGTKNRVMNVISLSDLNNPRHITRVDFAPNKYPDSIALCKYHSRRFLAIGFETLGTTSHAHVDIYNPFEEDGDVLTSVHEDINLAGYDPSAMAWTYDCQQLVVVQQGRVHKLNNAFDDPIPAIDVVSLTGINPSVTNIPVNAALAQNAPARHVLTQCEDDENKTSTLELDLEPRAVVIDQNTSTAYIAFPKNNVIARLNLATNALEEYINVGAKDWKSKRIDAVDDMSIKLENYPISTFYQPAAMALFRQNEELYIVTANTGEITSLNGAEDGCQFEESLNGIDWLANNSFSMDVSPTDKQALQNAMNDTSKLGNMKFTRLRTEADYYFRDRGGFSKVTGFGGRGMSILKTPTLQNVFESGDLFENEFTKDTTPSNYTAIFNADVGSSASSPTSRMDKTSPTTGATPRAVVVGEINGTLVVIVANSNVGGLYYFSVDRSGDSPLATFQGFIRRGNPGQSWNVLYNQAGDGVGEPEIKNIQWIDTNSDTEAMIAVLGNIAGVVSFYRVVLTN